MGIRLVSWNRLWNSNVFEGVLFTIEILCQVRQSFQRSLITGFVVILSAIQPGDEVQDGGEPKVNMKDWIHYVISVCEMVGG